MALTDSLVSCWELDEASGNALDAHGSITVTAVGSPGAASGKISGCRTFNGSTQDFTVASPAALEFGDVDFTICQWVNMASKAVQINQLSKWNPVGKRSYRTAYQPATDRFRFEVSNNGGSVIPVVANTFGSPSTGTWYWVVAYHDSAANQIGISVNNGAFDTASHTTGIHSNDSVFSIGSQTGATLRWNGSIDQTAIWGRILTSGELTSLYNGGAGLAYSSWAGGTFKPYWARRSSLFLGGM